MSTLGYTYSIIILLATSGDFARVLLRDERERGNWVTKKIVHIVFVISLMP